ncbi:LysR substrate-binding domain-containing protein [Paracoccus sp. 1_MG-2023]|nr:LysR substrate-binding domain-containing protein [Paracoccus sp. C2R09]MBU2956322.1 LysR family transcriptional regulator [Paracoccus sp. C2R09]MDO6667998.1 LysR substrate-binding domain-containing protein [Paracoccus sp. 1_MG-2023]
MRQRHFLPSLSQLIAFEAVMRHHSVTAAADELHLTQSTVSRLIRALEDRIGKPLFLRQNRSLIPLPEARAYQNDISRGLDIIQRASMSMMANPGGGTLSLSVLPTLATRWLAPHLGRFLDANPGISINLSTQIRRFSFRAETHDAAIYFGQQDWPDVRHLKLFDERLTACAAPGFLARHPVRQVDDMAGLPRLQLETRALGWTDWFAAHDAQPPAAAGMVMDQFSTMIQAAISGLGIALLPHYLARIEIEEGRLAPILTPDIPATGAYWLVWPASKDAHAPLVRFRDWLGQLLDDTP